MTVRNWSIEETRLVAHFELVRNDTISRYEVIDGQTVSMPIFEDRVW